MFGFVFFSFSAELVSVYFSGFHVFTAIVVSAFFGKSENIRSRGCTSQKNQVIRKCADPKNQRILFFFESKLDRKNTVSPKSAEHVFSKK